MRVRTRGDLWNRPRCDQMAKKIIIKLFRRFSTVSKTKTQEARLTLSKLINSVHITVNLYNYLIYNTLNRLINLALN